MQFRSQTTLAVCALVILIAIWSYNWVVMKMVLQYIGPLDFAALRCLFGALLLFLVLVLAGRQLAPPPLAPTLLIGIFQTVGMVGVSQLALVTGGAGSTAILVYTMPFWVTLLSAMFLGERIGRAHAVALALAGAGLLLVMQPWDGGGTLLNSCLSVLSGFSWAIGSVLAKKLFRRQPGIELLNLTAWQLLFGGIVIAVFAATTHEQPVILSGYLVSALIYNALLATAVAWTIWLYILKVLPTGISGLSMLLVPVCSVLFAWSILGEKPNSVKLIGIICIVAGLFLTTNAAFSLSRLKSGRNSLHRK